jgi:hypothetical protein
MQSLVRHSFNKIKVPALNPVKSLLPRPNKRGKSPNLKLLKTPSGKPDRPPLAPSTFSSSESNNYSSCQNIFCLPQTAAPEAEVRLLHL